MRPGDEIVFPSLKGGCDSRASISKKGAIPQFHLTMWHSCAIDMLGGPSLVATAETMEKRTLAKKKSARGNRNTDRVCVFQDHLECLGLFREGRPASYLMPLCPSDSVKEIGLYHRIEGIGIQGVGCGEGPYHDDLEIIVEKPRLLIHACSDEYDDRDHYEERFHMLGVTWPQGSKIHTKNRLIDGSRTARGKYHAGCVAKAVKNNEVYYPWIRFQIGENHTTTISIDDELLTVYLSRMALRHSRKQSTDKVDKWIIRFIFMADPDAFDASVPTIIREHPELIEALVPLLPSSFSITDPSLGLGPAYTVKQMAHKLPASDSTVRRVIKALSLKPVSPRRPFVYTAQDKERIGRYWANTAPDTF